MKTTALIALALLAAACSNRNGDYDASGTFEATEVIVSAEGNGRIERFDIEEGQRLTAGEVVGSIDSIQLYLKKLQLEKSIGATQSRRQDIAKQIAATLEQIDKQKLEQRRVQNLIRSNAANTKQLDDINSQLAVLEKQLAAQRSTLENNNRGVSEESSGLEIQIAQVEDQLGKCRIKSPISGTVLTKYAERGEVTAQGKPLFKIADTDSMKLRAYISSGQLTELKLGDPVRVFADAGDKGKILEAMPAPREDYKPFVPRIVQITIPQEFIGAVIGPGGKVIQEIQKQTGTTITITEDDQKGIVDVFGVEKSAIDAALQRIKEIVAVPEIGETYHGKIKSIVPFGAFVEIMPGKEALLHISEIDWKRFETMEESGLKEGEMIDVKLIGVDEKTGKLKLSHRALLPKPEGYVERERRPRGDRERRRDDRHRD